MGRKAKYGEGTLPGGKPPFSTFDDGGAREREQLARKLETFAQLDRQVQLHGTVEDVKALNNFRDKLLTALAPKADPIWDAWKSKLRECLEHDEPLGEGHVLGLLNDLGAHPPEAAPPEPKITEQCSCGIVHTAPCVFAVSTLEPVAWTDPKSMKRLQKKEVGLRSIYVVSQPCVNWDVPLFTHPPSVEPGIDGTIVGESGGAFHVQTNRSQFPGRMTLTNLEHETREYVGVEQAKPVAWDVVWGDTGVGLSGPWRTESEAIEFAKHFKQTPTPVPLYLAPPEPTDRLREALGRVVTALGKSFGDGSLARIAKHFEAGSEEWAIIHNADESIALAWDAAREALGEKP